MHFLEGQGRKDGKGAEGKHSDMIQRQHHVPRVQLSVNSMMMRGRPGWMEESGSKTRVISKSAQIWFFICRTSNSQREDQEPKRE